MPTNTLLTLASLLLILACHDPLPTEHAFMWGCHTDRTWDSIEVRQQLIGTWQEDLVQCDNLLFSGSAAKDRGTDGHTIIIREDGTLLVRDREFDPDTSYTWTLSQVTEPLLTFTSDYYSGLILFCEDRMEINGSHRGFCNRFYTRE